MDSVVIGKLAESQCSYNGGATLQVTFQCLPELTMRSVLIIALRCCLLTFVCVGIGGISMARSPNIIVVMPDDMGYGDLGVTGNPIVQTPNLDRFAGQSVHLTDFYVSPVCSPTRACLMTGRYNYRTRVIDTFKGRSMMDPAEVTVAEVLKEAGYATGIFGKWHLGDNYPMRPQDQGFDATLIHRGGGLAQPSEPIENANRYTDAILFRDGEAAQSKGYCTDVFFDAAIDFMTRCSERNQPYFVYLPPNAPHGPFHDVPEELREKYAAMDLSPVMLDRDTPKNRDTLARIYAMVENIDQNFGKLDRYLTDSGQVDDTVVIFLTDNGPATNRYVGPFREKKGDVHEGGIRTPFYIRWPGKLQPGLQINRIAAHIDLMPTLAAIASAEVPHDRAIDGVNLMPLLSGNAQQWSDRTLVLQTHRGNVPIEFHHFAARNQRWKLVRPSGFGNESLNPKVPFELYDLERDPREARDVIADHREESANLESAYRKWFADVSSTRPDNYSPPEIMIGSDAETTTDLSIQDWRVPNGMAGWGDGGKWFVNVVDAGPYDATVQWESPIGNSEVTLHVGDRSFTTALMQGETEAKFANLTLPIGSTTVHVECGKKPTAKTLYRFVTLKRR